MSEKCNDDIFKNGHSVAVLDACMYVAERWVQAVAKASGQRVDWHYTGGVANVLYIGNHARVDAAIDALAPRLAETPSRKHGECGSCDGDKHRAVTILRRYPASEHGPYRAGDPLPDDAIGVDVIGSL